MQLHLLLNYSSILLSHSCHHPFYLPEDFFFAVLPLSALRVLIPGFSHPLFFRLFDFFPLFGDLWQSSRNVWAPPQDGGGGTPICSPCGSPHCAPGSPAPPRVPATRCHLPNPYLVIPPPPPPSAPSSEAPEPPAGRGARFLASQFARHASLGEPPRTARAGCRRLRPALPPP